MTSCSEMSSVSFSQSTSRVHPRAILALRRSGARRKFFIEFEPGTRRLTRLLVDSPLLPSCFVWGLALFRRAAADEGTRLGRVVDFLLQVNLAAAAASVASDKVGVPVRTAGGTAPACSRERSRHARGVLDDFFHPVADRNRYRLPPNCPFDRSKDMYLEHEKHKEVVRRTQYKSLYSDKTFYNEYYVDKHMDNRHMDKVPPAPTFASRTTARCCGAMSIRRGNIRSFVRPSGPRRAGRGAARSG